MARYLWRVLWQEKGVWGRLAYLLLFTVPTGTHTFASWLDPTGNELLHLALSAAVTVAVVAAVVTGLVIKDAHGFDTAHRRAMQLQPLWELRSIGILLRNRRVTTQAEFDVWTVDFNVWRDAVLRHAAVFSLALANWLERLDQMQPMPQNLTFFNNEHARLTNVTSEILSRLLMLQQKEVLQS